MFRCGHGLLNQQGTISIQMLGYILMVTVCAGKDRKFRSRQLSKEMEHQAVHNKLAGAHLIPVAAHYHQKGDIGLFFKCPFVVLHLSESTALRRVGKQTLPQGALSQIHIWYLAVF